MSEVGHLPRLHVYGAGRVGSALALGAMQRGLPLVGLGSRTRHRVDETVALLRRGGWPTPVHHSGVPDRAVITRGRAEVLLLCISDPDLPQVVSELLRSLEGASGSTREPWALRVVLHSSGSLGSEVLAPLRQLGLAVGSMHPLLAFSEVEAAAAALEGATFGVEGDAPAREAATRLARALGGVVCEVPTELKPLYHAAAVMAANYAVALLDVAVEVASRAGLERPAALAAMVHLAQGALAGAALHDTAAALTGPIARGDRAVVQAHLDVMREQTPSLIELYARLGRRAVALAGRRPAGPPEGLAELDRLLCEVTSEDRRRR